MMMNMACRTFGISNAPLVGILAVLHDNLESRKTRGEIFGGDGVLVVGHELIVRHTRGERDSVLVTCDRVVSLRRDGANVLLIDFATWNGINHQLVWLGDPGSLEVIDRFLDPVLGLTGVALSATGPTEDRNHDH
jgi:hypothetical protein